MEQFRTETAARQADNSRDDINLLNMIESRIMEVIQIEDECKKKLPKLYHQRLARFMRRRAASHNIKRLPKKLRPPVHSDYGTKSRKALLKYRRRVRFRKHKRILKKHKRQSNKNSNKCLLHDWFAKRFKMTSNGDMPRIPLQNNTKNKRNLYRATRYGCAYLSLAHLTPIRLQLSCPKEGLHLRNQLQNLNRFTIEVSSFTFCAKSLEKGNYEVAVHLYRLEPPQREHLCCALVSFSGFEDDESKQPDLTLWVPKDNLQDVYDTLTTISEGCSKQFAINKICPSECIRMRFVGPNAHYEASKIAINKDLHQIARQDCDMRLNSTLGLSIGRQVKEGSAIFTYYNTKPSVVDIVFKSKAGKILWYKLIKNKAHLVGGLLDLNQLLVEKCFQLEPDI